MNEQDALALILKRNAFYRRLHFLALGALVLLVIIVITLFCMVLYLRKNPPYPLYFATDEIGRLIPIVPLNQPNMSDQDVAAWLTQGIEAANSYDYVNYRSQLQSSQKFFSDYGWHNFVDSLKASNNLLGVTRLKMVGVAQVVETPKLVTRGILAGKFAWKFTLPLLITYSQPPYNGTNNFSNSWAVTVIVQRAPILQSYRGLAIVQLIISPINQTTMPIVPSQP